MLTSVSISLVPVGSTSCLRPPTPRGQCTYCPQAVAAVLGYKQCLNRVQGGMQLMWINLSLVTFSQAVILRDLCSPCSPCFRYLFHKTCLFRHRTYPWGSVKLVSVSIQCHCKNLEMTIPKLFCLSCGFSSSRSEPLLQLKF